jgi:hypothetical protein
MIYWIGIIWLLAIVVSVFYLTSPWRKPKPVVRVVKPRPKGEEITLPQTQPLNQTIRSTRHLNSVPRSLEELPYIPMTVEEPSSGRGGGGNDAA